MNLKALKLFHNVVKLGSLASAATALYISPPAASRLLTLLESELDVTLFDRSKRRLQLTESGKYFFQSAEPILEGLQKLPSIAKASSKASERQLNILTSTPLGMSLVAPALRRLKDQMPDVGVQIDIKTRFEMVSKLGERVDEIGIASFPIGHQTLFELHLQPLISCEQMVMLHQSHPLAKRAYLEARDLQEETLILLKEHQQMGRVGINNLFLEKGLTVDNCIEVTSSLVAMTLCQQQIGLTITNALFAQLASQFDCVSVPLLPKQRLVFGYILPDRDNGVNQLSLMQQLFIEQMMQYVRSLDKESIKVINAQA